MFKSENTRPNPFFRQDQSPIQVPMLRKTGRFPYWEDDMVQIISVPFLTAST
jgi:serine protease inhibitor